MRYTRASLLLLSALLLSFKGERDHSSRLTPQDWHTLRHIPEPSDIVYDNINGRCFIVSDHGILYECAADCSVINKANNEGMDFEGVEVKDGFIYVSDETPRKVYKYRESDLGLEQVYSVSYAGPMNKAFESIAYNQKKHCFLMVTQQPAVIYEYDDNFHLLDKIAFHDAGDISSARWYNGSIYLLSSKADKIFKCDPFDYHVIQSYKLDIINPEGLAFDTSGKFVITSDDLQRIYFFNSLPR